MNKEVICNGISVCTEKCEHKVKHEKYSAIKCDWICRDQKEKGNFSCKDYIIIMRKIKLKNLNGITNR